MPSKGTRLIPLSINPDIEKQVRANKHGLLSKTNKTESSAWKAACKQYVALTDLVSQASPEVADLQAIKAKSLIDISGLQKSTLKKKKLICFRSIDPDQQVWIQD